MAAANRAGGSVVRLHTGDPHLYGAIGEQMRALDALGIAYEVVPGVSSFVAAAAALPSELTLPGVSQTVIITRQPGRTPVPPGQDVSSLAAHRATMAVFLSAGQLEETVAALREHYPGRDRGSDRAARLVAAAEGIARYAISTIEAAARQAGIDRTAMILVGDVLRNEGEASLLYDRSFSHRYRQGERSRPGGGGFDVAATDRSGES